MEQIHRGRLLHFPKSTVSPELNYQYWDDGVLITKNGMIHHIGDAKDFFASTDYLKSHCHENVIEHTGLLLPGLIDSHVHFPQIEMIASYGKQLLDWLNDYTFPTEIQFANHKYAEQQADFFLQQLLSHGTTTAGVYATVHKSSVDAFFTASQKLNTRMICGKVLMDRNCPEPLRDGTDHGYLDSKRLIESWHNNGRSLYAITPRFAPTSTEEQLVISGQLAREHPDVFIQTHLSENINEISWVKSLFPQDSDYLSVYQRHHLVRERALFGHAVHLQTREYQALAENGAAISFCPSSNLFLGSGLFPYQNAKQAGIPISLASDVGAGTSLSLLQNLSDSYKICQLQNISLNPFEALYLCTQGAAVALKLEHLIGNLNPGSEADFIEVDLHAFPMISQRIQGCKTLEEQLFALIILGDDRVIAKTYVAGKLVYKQQS